MSRRKDRVKREPGKEMVCPFCGYGSHISPFTGEKILWVARVENPKQCPECKRYLSKYKGIPGMKPMPVINAAKGAGPFISSLSGTRNP